MAIDTSPLGQLTAQVMEGIDEEFGESEAWESIDRQREALLLEQAEGDHDEDDA